MENLPPLRYPEPQTVLTVEDMRRSDAACIAAGTSGTELMARAGRGVFKAYPWQGPVAILCGTGNNGADGICVANILNADKKISTAPTVVITGSLEHASWEFLHQLSEYKKAGFTPLFARSFDFQGFDVLVDAVFGIGLKSALREDKAQLLREADKAGFKHVIAVDMPSGINSDSGELTGAGIHATVTITFGKMKTGLANGDGPEYAGEVTVRDIGIPEEAYLRSC